MTFLWLQEDGNGSLSVSTLLGEGRNFNSGVSCFLHQVEDMGSRAGKSGASEGQDRQRYPQK